MADEAARQSTLDDLGPSLAALLTRLLEGQHVSVTEFEAASLEYFNGTPFPDDYFNILAALSLQTALAAEPAARLLNFGLELAERWDAVHPGRRLHKGSGYYFAGMRDVLRGDLPKGFLLMHQALVEDQLSSGQHDPSTPANAFVTLDAEKGDQAFRDQTVRYAALLDDRLDRYRASRSGHLTRAALRLKLSKHADLVEPLFQMVYCVARLDALEAPTVRALRENRFARGLFGRLISDLCLLIEQAVSVAQPGQDRFIQTASAYAAATQLSLLRVDFDDVHQAFSRDFGGTINALIGGKYAKRSGVKVGIPESDLMIAYGIRNETAHTVSVEHILGRRFERIEVRLFHCLFRALETLYP